LTRAEFERRYEAMPHVNKAELLEGIVYMPSPVRAGQHGIQHSRVSWWLTSYLMGTPGVEAADNSTVRLEGDNEPQPDVLMFIEPAFGGTVDMRDGYIEGAPDLLAEVSASTASIDLNVKFNVYRRNRAREYIVWRVMDEAIDWFILRGEQYERLPPGADGIYRSEAFPGLWLDGAAMVRSDLARVLEVLQQGLATPEHAAFVAQLQQNAARKTTS
jgi:Uma2 family endonuclease